ncbi:N-acetyltransferase DgcN [Terasakiella pusilla]|uniref:N-acetyltransferase DgcN n=1 Tax=Terasakiella pusilla TaxID=64973 RepID=UPI003AA8D310
MPIALPTPYALFLGNETDISNAKTAAGIAHWQRENCVCQIRLENGTVDLSLADMTVQQAVKSGAKCLVIGVANFGGVIAPDWLPVLKSALEAGLDVAAGLHARLNDIAELRNLAEKYGRKLYDIRQPEQVFRVGSGVERTGNRLLTVGTDCSVGKMYTSLAIEKELRMRGCDATFRATGQTGVFIARSGVCVDAVVSDFISGAAESLSPDNAADHWDIVEGQGSLFHPAFAGVTLGLLHGSQPDALVLCHDATRETIEDYLDFPIPEFGRCMETYIAAASLTAPNVQFVGMSINTSKLNDIEAHKYLVRLEHHHNLPCCDPVRTGVAAIVDRMLKINDSSGDRL